VQYENEAQFASDIEGFNLEDNFVMRWRGTVTIAEAGQYTFATDSDDGSMVYIDGQLIVDNDRNHGSQHREGTVDLTVGPHAIKITFFEHGGGATMGAQWSPTPGASLQRLGGSAFTNSIGCGDDQQLVSAGDRCAIGFCESPCA
jgi:hypothetical protein